MTAYGNGECVDIITIFVPWLFAVYQGFCVVSE